MSYANQLIEKQAHAAKYDADMAMRGGLAGYGQDAAGRQPEIPAGLDRLDMQVCTLAEVVSRLDDRMTGPVARQHPPANETKGQLKAANQSGIGGKLDSLADQIQGLRDRLGSLLDRLEI